MTNLIGRKVIFHNSNSAEVPAGITGTINERTEIGTFIVKLHGVLVKPTGLNLKEDDCDATDSIYPIYSTIRIIECDRLDFKVMNGEEND